MADQTLRLPASFEEAIRPYERELMRFVLRMSGNRDDALELFQGLFKRRIFGGCLARTF